jgi:hypothetical protein
MKFYWLRFLLLTTFVFWATGAAKYTHEVLEHHGQDASIDDDDDDDSSAGVATAALSAPTQQDPSHPPAKHACPICQMLAGMAVERSTPPALPTNYLPLIETLIIADHVAPIVHASFDHTARGPPGCL